MRERRTVDILPRQRPVYTFFASERVAAGYLSKNGLYECDAGCGCGGKKEVLRFIMNYSVPPCAT
jgi:hypothetical protein